MKLCRQRVKWRFLAMSTCSQLVCQPVPHLSCCIFADLICVQGEGNVDHSGSTLPRKASLGRGLPPLRGRVPAPNTHRKGVIAEPLALYDFLRPAIEQHREDFRM